MLCCSELGQSLVVLLGSFGNVGKALGMGPADAIPAAVPTWVWSPALLSEGPGLSHTPCAEGTLKLLPLFKVFLELPFLVPSHRLTTLRECPRLWEIGDSLDVVLP